MSSTQPELVFFLDRSLGKQKVAEVLRATGREVKIHDEEFDPATQDDVWLPAVGERGWVVLTKDEHIRYRRNELSAVMNSGVRLFVLTSGNLTGEEMAHIFASALPAIERAVARHPGPFVAAIDRGARVSVLVDRSAPPTPS